MPRNKLNTEELFEQLELELEVPELDFDDDYYHEPSEMDEWSDFAMPNLCRYTERIRPILPLSP